MEFNRNEPTEPGWYWFSDKEGVVEMVELKLIGSPPLNVYARSWWGETTTRLIRFGGAFAGPIPVPTGVPQ